MDKFDTSDLATAFCIGAMLTSIVFGFIITPIYESIRLHSVGIERIEHCHNVHSNWNEIVWIDKTK